ncbi:MAG: molybdenum ABC transporter ATP-binding protein [Pseudomonadota bacterium]|nr:molybdenum ABC transporter ATP-binding protein [Pseudomonadota bacterium]
MAEGIRARIDLSLNDFRLDVDLNLPGRGVTALFGQSGSGKTTLLRCIAGLQATPDALISVNGEVWQDERTFVPVHRRPLGYVFQEASLFGHLSVRKNLEYGLKRVPMAQRTVAQQDVIELLGIASLLGRSCGSLSGGERQRVAIARALAVSPRLLLMDEPLASLDVARKQEILPYLQRLHDDLDIPVLYVSHSPDEIARLADHVVLLAEGRAVAQGGLHETLSRLDMAGMFADDVGVVIDAVVAQHDDLDHLSRLDFQGGVVWVSRCAESVGQRIRFRIHASDVSLAIHKAVQSSFLNLLACKAIELTNVNARGQVLVKLDMAGTPLIARITERSRKHLEIAPGRPLWAQIKSVALLR